jgi:hypothetical protein
MEGDYENRQVWQNVPFQHSNAQAQEIGRRQLTKICEACGITTRISNPEPFQYIPCKIRVGIEKDKSGIYDDKNVVTGVWPASFEPPSASRSTRPPKPTQAAWASSSKPSSTQSPAAPAQSPAAPSAQSPAAPARNSPAPKSPAPNSSFKSSPKLSPASMDKLMKEGVRFTDQWQPPDSSPASSSSSTDNETKAMIIGLHLKSRLAPQEISEALAKININIPASVVETLLVVWGKYDIGVAGSKANGGTPPQAASQTPSQPQTPSQTPPTQASPQASPQAPSSQTSFSSQPSPQSASDGGSAPWRD